METVEITIDKETGEILEKTEKTVSTHDMDKLNGQGVRNLVIAVIVQAVNDVKALTEAGIIEKGKVVAIRSIFSARSLVISA